VTALAVQAGNYAKSQPSDRTHGPKLIVVIGINFYHPDVLMAEPRP
jgi:hypothetical protein